MITVPMKVSVQAVAVPMKVSVNCGQHYDKYTGEYEVTPSKQTQTLQTEGLLMEQDVTVIPIPSAYIIPEGTKEISIVQNGVVTQDVTDYASAEISVNVPLPSGTKNLSYNANGEYTENVNDYSSAHITVAVPQPSGSKPISLTANGNYTENVEDYVTAEISVAIPSAVGVSF